MHSFDKWLREELYKAGKALESLPPFSGNDCPEFARWRQLEDIWRRWANSVECYLSQDIKHEDEQ